MYPIAGGMSLGIKIQLRVLNKWKNGKESAEDVYMLKIMSKE